MQSPNVLPSQAAQSSHVEHVIRVEDQAREKVWYLYLLECAGGRYYAGVTNRLSFRMRAHRSGKGAKFTRGNRPVQLLGARSFPGKSEAMKAEWAIKQLPRAKKLHFLFETSHQQCAA